ncbi:helix-turn-helix domain-containing protein [Methylobacterium fujisawaense]
MARISLSELRTRASTVDRAKVDATTEADILAQRSSDPDAPAEMPTDAQTVEPPKALRVRLGMTQSEIAAALGIPVGTWRNWEQGRVRLDPTASALLRIISREPAIAFAVLAPAASISVDEEIVVTSQRLMELIELQSGRQIDPEDVAASVATQELLQRVMAGLPQTRHG